MTENVIEKLVGEWEGKDYHWEGPHTKATLSQCADELQAATRPEQFMPPLREWPEDATHAKACFVGIVHYIRWTRDDPFSGGVLPRSAILGEHPERLKVPLGIDWRTLKVSRAQMEKWEAENG